MNESAVRVRFAPSPTGHLHIGGVRTALFNFLYARLQNGRFLVRIEDTDRERSAPEYEKEILDSLEWLGLTWDEPLKRQSERLEHYREAAGQLLREGKAYEEKHEGKTAVRFRMPEREIVLRDLVHGEARFDARLFEDLIILKSDGYPTYHLACVVDDQDMQISHVIRGDDHFSNTPRQLLLYEALGWKAPKFAHVPLILGHDGAPLSKRHGAVSLEPYRAQGYLPQAVLNYLALLGWRADANQEFFMPDELIRRFSIKKIQKSGARFDPEKLEWLNGQHLMKLPEDDFIALMSTFFPEEAERLGDARWKRLALLYQPRIKTLAAFRQEAWYCFEPPREYDSEKRTGFLNQEGLRGHLETWREKVSEMKNFESHETLEALTRALAECLGVKVGVLIHPLRFALTAQTNSPGLFELMSVLGREECLDRVNRFLVVEQP